MTGADRTGRPLQLLIILATLLVGWMAGRWPLLERNFAAAVASGERAQLAIDIAVQAAQFARAALPHIAAVEVAQGLAAIQQLGALPPSLSTPVAATAATDRIVPVAKPASVVQSGRSRSSLPPPAQVADYVSTATRLSPAEDTSSHASFAPAVATLPAATLGTSHASHLAARQPPSQRTAFDFATSAYIALAAGNRHVAAHEFDAALAIDSADPHAPAWAVARRALRKRWSGSVYAFERPSSSSTLASLSPGAAALLGGSQSGAALAFALDPLARRPLDLTARVTDSTGLDQRQAEAAVGMRWQFVPQLSLSAERLIALGSAGRHDWTLRLAGGQAGRIGPVAFDAYSEAGIVSLTHPALFAAGQGHIGRPIAIGSAFTLIPAAGVWAGIQHDRLATTDRVDVGPSLRLHWLRKPLPIDLALDYRVRVAGNAAPGTGITLLLSTDF